MPLARRRTTLLGCQPIPPFSKSFTLHQNPICWDDYTGSEGGFPAAESIFNIGCVVLFPRGRLAVNNSAQASLVGLSRTYWSTQVRDGIRCLYSESRVMIPQGAEFFSVSWLKPPDWTIGFGGVGPYPEDLFRMEFHLAL